MVGCPDNLREPGGRNHQEDKVRCLPSVSTCHPETLTFSTGIWKTSVRPGRRGIFN